MVTRRDSRTQISIVKDTLRVAKVRDDAQIKPFGLDAIDVTQRILIGGLQVYRVGLKFFGVPASPVLIVLVLTHASLAPR